MKAAESKEKMKLEAMKVMDWLHPMAQKIGAINCIVVKDDGALHGFKFDAEGFIESLLEARPGWQASDGPAVVLGAGVDSVGCTLTPKRTAQACEGSVTGREIDNARSRAQV